MGLGGRRGCYAASMGTDDAGSARRWARFGVVGWVALALFALAYVASLRWAFVISPAPSLGVGLIAGGVWLNPNYSAPPNPPTIPGGWMVNGKMPVYRPPVAAPPSHQALYVYRHGFGMQRWIDM